MAGLGTVPAADAGIHVDRGFAREVAHEGIHRCRDALRRRAVAFEVHGIAPRRPYLTPVIPRDQKASPACISLPNGNHSKNSSTVSRCTAM